MTLHFRWSEADYVSARWALLKSHPAHLALAFWYPAAMLIAIGIGAVENPSAWRFQLVLVLISVGFTALLMLLRRWIWSQDYKKTPFWHEEVWAVIDDQSIKLQGETFGPRATGENCRAFTTPSEFSSSKREKPSSSCPRRR
jgi:hypothetical protein